MRPAGVVEKLGGIIKKIGGVAIGVFFSGPTEAPENSLFIPLEDFGYTKERGIFRESLRPGAKSEVNF